MDLHDTLGVGLVVIAFVFLAIAARMLLWNSWFVQWLKGTIGLGLIILVGFICLSLFDLMSYKQAVREYPAATVTTHRLGEQLYDVSVVDREGKERRYRVLGDQWQMDFRLMAWKGPVSSLGRSPLYRIDRLTGRYLSIEQEKLSGRSLYELDSSRWLDTWLFLRGKRLWLDADFGSSVFMPMKNGAVYSVHVTGKGVIARPSNDVAIDATSGDW